MHSAQLMQWELLKVTIHDRDESGAKLRWVEGYRNHPRVAKNFAHGARLVISACWQGRSSVA